MLAVRPRGLGQESRLSALQVVARLSGLPIGDQPRHSCIVACEDAVDLLDNCGLYRAICNPDGGIGTLGLKAMGAGGMPKSQVSGLCAEIGERVNAVLTRPLEGAWPCLWREATYPKVREIGRIVSWAGWCRTSPRCAAV